MCANAKTNNYFAAEFLKLSRQGTISAETFDAGIMAIIRGSRSGHFQGVAVDDANSTSVEGSDPLNQSRTSATVSRFFEEELDKCERSFCAKTRKQSTEESRVQDCFSSQLFLSRAISVTAPSLTEMLVPEYVVVVRPQDEGEAVQDEDVAHTRTPSPLNANLSLSSDMRRTPGASYDRNFLLYTGEAYLYRQD
jgi:hypothetical protein